MLANVQQATIKPIIKAGVAAGTTVYTDEYDIYTRLSEWGYEHKSVHHGAGEYARDEDGDGFHEIHVNTMAASALGHFAGEAAKLPRLLPVRSQRPQTRQATPRRARRNLDRMTTKHHPETPDEPLSLLSWHFG
jgi:transposase-like protein